MSKLHVEVVEIDEINKHPNADRLELATVKGWQCVVGLGQYKKGEKVVYIPIDSVLPEKVESLLFAPDAKVKLSKHRVKTIKIRQAISQGMIAPLDLLGIPRETKVGTDVCEELGITKYEPPPDRSVNPTKGGRQRPKQKHNPDFKKYTDIEHLKYFPEALKEKTIVLTEKIHGTNFRAGIAPFAANTLWKKILQFLRLTPKYEFVFGSHNVQLQEYSKKHETYYDTNVYYQMTMKYKLREVLEPGITIYAEIYGYNIQKNYFYGLNEPGQHDMVVIDIMKDGRYMDEEDMIKYCKEKGFQWAPVLYIGPYNKEILEKETQGRSVLAPKTQPVREGCVVKPVKEEHGYMGRMIFKSINPEYLLKDQSEGH